MRTTVVLREEKGMRRGAHDLLEIINRAVTGKILVRTWSKFLFKIESWNLLKFA